MTNANDYNALLDENGFVIVDGMFSEAELSEIVYSIESSDSSRSTFRKSSELFAIRQFLREVPETVDLVFKEKLCSIVQQLFGPDFFVTKSIYFDKPSQSNWFVAYHQDLTISVDKRIDHADFGPWTVKQNQFAVQPPVEVLERNFTIRIHLDNTDENNGALKVIPGSHKRGIYRSELIDWTVVQEVVCRVPKGGIMIMRPLLLHSSSRSTNNEKRRVIHIEFSNQTLPSKLKWSEYLEIKGQIIQ